MDTRIKILLSVFVLAVGISVMFYEKDGKIKLPERTGENPLQFELASETPFTVDMGNNHDAIYLPGNGGKYAHYLIIGNWESGVNVWGTNRLSPHSQDWELISASYQLGGDYEYDDGLLVDGTYYIYEGRKVYTYSGNIEDGSGKWTLSGTFPDDVDDVGVFYENRVFHIFGEYGKYENRADGISLAHLTSPTGLGDWTLHNTKAVDPSPGGKPEFGVGDADIIKIGDIYFLTCDIERTDQTYRVVGYVAHDLFEQFKFGGVVAAPRAGTENYDNNHVQDAEMVFDDASKRWMIFANQLDTDGNPGPKGRFPKLDANTTKVIGVYIQK